MPTNKSLEKTDDEPRLPYEYYGCDELYYAHLIGEQILEAHGVEPYISYLRGQYTNLANLTESVPKLTSKRKVYDDKSPQNAKNHPDQPSIKNIFIDLLKEVSNFSGLTYKKIGEAIGCRGDYVSTMIKDGYGIDVTVEKLEKLREFKKTAAKNNRNRLYAKEYINSLLQKGLALNQISKAISTNYNTLNRFINTPDKSYLKFSDKQVETLKELYKAH